MEQLQSQCHLALHKSQMDYSGTVTGSSRLEDGDKLSEPRYGTNAPPRPPQYKSRIGYRKRSCMAKNTKLGFGNIESLSAVYDVLSNSDTEKLVANDVERKNRV